MVDPTPPASTPVGQVDAAESQADDNVGSGAGGAGGGNGGGGRGGGARGLLVLGWCLWLLGAWVGMWAWGGWTVPALRAMVFAGMLGIMGVWPAVRLSQATPTPTPESDPRKSRRGGVPTVDPQRGGGPLGEPTAGAWLRVCAATAGDWLALNLVFQAVIWPLRLAAGWAVLQAAWLAGAVGAWSLLTALLIAWGRGGNDALRRSAAMIACVGVVLAEPLLWWLAWRAGVLGGVGETAMRLSPLQALWHFTAPGLGPRSLQLIIQQQGAQVLGVAAAAAAGWLVLTGLLRWTRARAD